MAQTMNIYRRRFSFPAARAERDLKYFAIASAAERLARAGAVRHGTS